MATMDSLPTELLQHIFKHIHPTNVLQYTRLSRKIYNALLAPYFASLTIQLHPSSSPLIRESYSLTPLDKAWFLLPAPFQSAHADRNLHHLTKLAWYEIRRSHPDARNPLARHPLRGAIPHAVGRLVQLRYLEMSKCALRGPIPVEVGQLVQLEFLGFSFNQLSGEIPGAALQRLRKLKGLHLKHNLLSGVLPEEIGWLDSLQALEVSDNLLEGPLPVVALDKLTKLRYFAYFNNPGIVGEVSDKMKTQLGVFLNFTVSDVGPQVGPLFFDES
ncbi:hypothetical protein BC830DRAFT_1100569 [Chytriomyces sp. MP71]|nr:hypothetical protein BC830DRAFT_1100569 [Chytriomyces sp. MP71]